MDEGEQPEHEAGGVQDDRDPADDRKQVQNQVEDRRNRFAAEEQRRGEQKIAIR